LLDSWLLGPLALALLLLLLFERCWITDVIECSGADMNDPLEGPAAVTDVGVGDTPGLDAA